MIEVEMKIPIYRRSLTEKSLRDIGFVPGDLLRETDLYYTSDFHDFMKSDEALRIRVTNNLSDNTMHSYITYKGRRMDRVSMTRKELETQVEDPDTMKAILEALGYRHLFPVTKLRQLYHRDGICACVDQVEGLGSFLELELMAENEEDYSEKLSQLDGILPEIGSSHEETTTSSYLSMLLKKQKG